ncbi:MAG: TRAP transporter substrate-binding protein [Acidobacteriota bacterium]
MSRSKSPADAATPSKTPGSERSVPRRKFLTGAAVGAAAAAAGCAPGSEGGESAAVQTKPRLTWRLASSFPRGLDTIYGAAEVFAERVAKLTDDRFQIRCYPANELVPALQVLDAVQQGTVQIGHSASYYFKGKNPALAFDTAMPFGLTARQQNAWLYHGGGLELMQEVFSDFNVRSFPGGNTGTQMGGWFRREIGSLADLRGLKMRIPGHGAEVMAELGVTVQTLAGSEIYPALERGAIDATEWIGPYDDEKLGFQRVAQYYYYPGWWEPGPNLSIYVNQDDWAKLPAAYQEVFEAAAYEANMTMLSRYDAENPAALARLVEGGVQLRPFAQDIMEAAQTQAEAILEQEASEDPTYRKIYDSWKAMRSSSYEWFSRAEMAYASFAFGR